MFQFEPLSKNCHKFYLKEKSVPTYQCSDIHLDSMKCRRDLLKNDLDEVKAAGGLIFIYGDILDIMATYGDRRMRREGVDPQFIVKGRSYIDVVCEYAVEFLRPYSENIAFISYGNHEQTILDFHDTDPLRRIVYTLNQFPNTNIALGQYTGWVLFERFEGRGRSFSLQYHHGFGGSAKRSKGILNVQLEVMRYPDADLLVRGHTHQKWYDPSTARQRISKNGNQYKDKVKYLQMGAYKDGLSDGAGSFENKKNFNPTDIGGWNVHFDWTRTHTKEIDMKHWKTTVTNQNHEIF